tara:strand:- start:27 stop:761 length:735 start_codon:yes stop_codon:yes gene_type:complete
MSDEIKKTMDEALEDLFANANTSNEITAKLPSRGIGYPGNKEEVVIRAMTFEDEKALASLKAGEDIIQSILSRCVSDIDIDNLYGPDKLFLLLKLRELSFGDSFKVTAACTICKEENDLEILLSQLPVTLADENFTDPKEITLPNLNSTAMIRLPRSGDSNLLSSHTKILDNLWRFVKKIGNYEDPKVIAKAIKKLKSADIRTILSSLLVEDFGIETTALFVCSNCGEDTKVDVPITESFFTVS